MKKIIGIVVMLLLVVGCSNEHDNFKFAVLSDVHVQDVEAEFKSNIFSGANINDDNYTIRPMSEQMGSTRLFNENYYAFEQVLSDLAHDGIKYVVITGDITDDGQEMNVKEVASILDRYESEYQMNFYLLPGNHEPSTIKNDDGGDNFLKNDGSSIEVKSPISEECQQGNNENLICDDQMISLGQSEMTNILSEFGYMPDEEDIMWATPYSSYQFADYNYEFAKDEMDIENRKYQVCNEQEECVDEYDLTYAVEPVEDYIFLCLDNNVYMPEEEGNTAKLQGDNGFNLLNEEKPQTFKFINDVANYAEENGKQVILFDHYPLTDFYAGATDELIETFGKDGLNFNRLPDQSITEQVAASGISLAFSGHMHYNATGEYQNGDDYLVNVMTGSTAAYVPSYKVITSTKDGVYDIETKVVETVKDFDILFPLYETEYDYEQTLSDDEKDKLGITNWDKDILNADNYYEFNRIFLETLVQTRHYPEWSTNLKAVFDNLNLYEMVVYGLYEQESDPVQFVNSFNSDKEVNNLCANFDQFLNENNIDKQELEQFTGIDVVTMFYKFLSARDLAYEDYTKDELNAFSAAITYLSNNQLATANSEYTSLYVNILSAIYMMANDVPSNHFEVDLTNKQITDLSNNKTRISIIE